MDVKSVPNCFAPDMMFTSHLAFKLRCKSLPQLGKKGDHDIVLYDCSHKVVRSKPPRKKIYLWKKVPEENIISGAKQFGTDFTSMHFESIEHMWAVFKNGIISLMCYPDVWGSQLFAPISSRGTSLEIID
jgi:hypothetical protein